MGQCRVGPCFLCDRICFFVDRGYPKASSGTVSQGKGLGMVNSLHDVQIRTILALLELEESCWPFIAKMCTLEAAEPLGESVMDEPAGPASRLQAAV